MYRTVAGVLSSALIAAFLAIGSAIASDPSNPSVLIVEATQSDLGYAVAAAGSKSDPAADVGEVMAVLRSGLASGPRVAILIGPDVPVRAFTTVRSLASKVGFTEENVRFFAFDKKRRGMVAVDLEAGWVDYETDGPALSKHFN